MRVRELRQHHRQSTPLAINILSDGYDYLVQIELERGTEPLTDPSGRQLVFRNLGDAEQQLRSIGIHRATLRHQVAHDEGVGRADDPEQSRMPLYF